MKILKNNFRIIFFKIVSFVSISFFLFFLCHVNFSSNINRELNLAISKRLADYQDVFNYLENSHRNTDILKAANVLSNKTLYLHNRKIIPLGAIETCLFSSLKRSNNKTPDSSDKSLCKVYCSKAFMDLNLINEPLVRLTYTFLSNENNLITYSTTVLAKDIFVYAQHIDKLSITPNKERYTEHLFFIPLIDAYTTISYVENMEFFIILELLLLIVFQCLSQIFKYRENKRIASFNFLNMKLLQEENSELMKKNSILREIEYPPSRNKEEDIYPFKVISHLLSLHEAKIADRNIKCHVNKGSDLFFRGNKADWNVLLGSFMEVLIVEAPPNSIFNCSIKEIYSPSDDKILQIIFKDELPIFRNLEERILSNSFCHAYVCIRAIRFTTAGN